jgi:DNA polymerase-3 subunit delta
LSDLGPGRAAWLVEGDDPVLVADRTRALIAELLQGADAALAVEDFSGEEVDLAAVADACRTPPFLADRRVVVVRDVGARSTEELAPILAYLEDPSPSTALVLVGGGGRLSTKLSASVKAHGHVVATSVSGREASNWVRERIRESSLRVDGPAASLIEAHLGEDVSRLSALLEVLLAVYGPGGRVGPAELEPYLGAAGSVAPWDLTDAIDAGNGEVALSILHRLLGAGERHPLVVLAILVRHVQAMLRVESPSITSEAQAAAAMGIAKGRSTFPARKALNGARRLGPGGVTEAIALLAEAEVQLKGALEWPGELVLEVLVARLCRLSRVPARSTAPRR